MPNRLRRPEGPQVFQREDDTSLHRNLGFMVIKVDRRVKKLFEHVGLAAATSGRVRGGVHRGPNFPAVKAIKAPTDQMVLNVALWEPEKLFTLDDAFVAGAARPILKTTVFPAAEVATRAFLLQLALRYKQTVLGSPAWTSASEFQSPWRWRPS